jgi:hypothetical protein
MKFTSKKRLKKLALYGTVLSVLAVGLVGLHVHTSIFLITPKAKYERLDRKIDAAIERNDWHKVLALCNELLTLAKVDLDNGRVEAEDVAILWMKTVIHTKYALVLTGELLENFLSYTRFHGFTELIPKLEGYFSLLPSAYQFLSALELHSLALASAFNRFENSGNPSDLNNFIQSSLIVGDYLTPTTFINRLEQHRKWRRKARTYRELLADTAKINADPYYIARRKLGPREDFMANWELDRSIADFNASNPYNQRVFEYTLMYALLNNFGAHFAGIITLLEQFDYDHIPRHLEEAILMFSGYGWSPEIHRNSIMTETFGGFTIRPETIFRHERFVQHLSMLQNGQIDQDWFIYTYRDTYQLHHLINNF